MSNLPDHFEKMSDKKYLAKEEVMPPLLLTIKDIVVEDVGIEEDREEKWVCYWEEDVKPLILNHTNRGRIAKFTNEVNPNNWIGKKIVAYNDEGVEFKGKITGGIRLRAPRQQAQEPAQQPAPNTEKDDPGPTFDDSLPF